MCGLLGVLAAGGCGGGQVAGQASTAPVTEAAAPSTTATPTTPTTTTKRAPRRPTRTTATTPTRTTATQPPATTTQPSTTPTTSTTTATHPARTTPKPASDPGTPIDETAQLLLVSKASATEYTQSGTVSGTYDGQMTLTAKITNAGIVVDFTVTAAEGTVSGHGLAIVHITGAKLEPITGTTTITGGTGRFAGAHGTGLKVSGRVALDASRGTVHLTGTIFY